MTEFLEPELPAPPRPAMPQNAPRVPIDSSGWLTTGEAYSAAVALGWQGSKGTFRRRLEERSVPADLAALGLVAEFDRRAVNPKSNAIRWLKFS